VSQYENRIADHDVVVAQDLLKLVRRLCTFVRRQEGLSAEVNGVKRAKGIRLAAARRAHFVGSAGLQLVDRLCGCVPFESGDRANDRQVIEPDGSILWEILLQVMRELLRLGRITGKSQGNGHAVFHLAVGSQSQGCGCVLSGLLRISEKCLP